ncbi:MAG: ATP-binding cassette domain-containing protein [Bacilli bacterium]|nr:ATP-binding cassette domain-containing protein [Bacilli bacterium]
MPEIRLENLSFSYKKKKIETPVIEGLSYTFEANKIHVILGKSGCGKTTLLKCINGLSSYEGHIYYDDVEMDGTPVGERKLGYVSQEFGVYPHFDLFTSIAYPLRIAGASGDESRKRVHEIAKELGIDNILSRKPRQVSVGQVQRAALARALIKRPNIILFDEPLSNVDEKTRREIVLLIKETVHKFGMTAIYVCHDVGEATSLADKIHVMDKGRFVVSGDPLELMKSEDAKVASLFEDIRDEAI